MGSTARSRGILTPEWTAIRSHDHAKGNSWNDRSDGSDPGRGAVYVLSDRSEFQGDTGVADLHGDFSSKRNEYRTRATESECGSGEWRRMGCAGCSHASRLKRTPTWRIARRAIRQAPDDTGTECL